MTKKNNNETKAEALLLVVVLIWALNAPLAKYGLSGLNVWIFNSIRFVCGAIVLSAVFLRRSEWARVTSNDWMRLVRLGIIANVVYQFAYIWGLKLTTAGNSAVLLSTSPLWTAVINAKLNKEPIPRQALAGMIVSFIGIILIIVGSGKKLEFGSQALWGDLLSLGAAVLWAFNTTLQKPLLSKFSAMQLSVISISVGAIGLSIPAIPNLLTLDFATIDSKFWVIPILSGTLSIAIANVFWSYGVKHLGPRRTGVFNNLVPVIAFVASYFALNEDVFVIQAVGAAITVGGVWVARR
jgi:drug/metabolite transporter (DMT)-like permease